MDFKSDLASISMNEELDLHHWLRCIIITLQKFWIYMHLQSQKLLKSLTFNPGLMIR